MVVGELPEPVDFLVVGGGPGGYVAALAAAQHGRRVVLVDRDGEAGLGGVCVNVGCIPSKALIEMTGVAHDAVAWAGRGITGGQGLGVDLAVFQEWKGQVVAGLNGGVRQLLKAAGVQVRTGHFRFTRKDQGALDLGANELPVHLKFESCVLATGSRPAPLPGLTRDGTRILDSTDVLNLRVVPARTVIVGGGYIGVELGTALAKCGSAVTLVEATDRILGTLPTTVTAPVVRRLAELGVEVITEASAHHDDGRALTVMTAAGELRVECDVVAVVAGRIPNTDDLGLEVLGVTPDERGLLAVGDDLLITPRVAAIGDITPGPALAHRASAQAHAAVRVLSGERSSYAPLAVPAVVFSDPEIAVTGITVEQARDAGLEASAATFPLAASGRARTVGGSNGTATIVHTPEGIVMGAQLVGPHVSELIGEVTLAIEMGATLEDLALAIHPHPTMSESLVEAAAVGLGVPVHVVPRHRAARPAGS